MTKRKRKLLTLGISLLLMFICSCVQNVEEGIIIPDLSIPGKGAYLAGELIFPLDQKPTPQCHASTIAEISNGLIVAWFGGTHESNPDVGIWISRIIDGSWSKPVEVVNGIMNDTLRYPCWNPVLFSPEGGPLMLFYKVGPSPREWWGMVVTSDNEGESWSLPEKLGSSEPTGHLIGPVKNKPVQLADGTIICPSSTEEEQDGNIRWRVHFEITCDLGKTWEVIGPINDGVEFDAIQPSILTHTDGTLQILCRTRQDVISQSWSEDNGKTWSKMTATGLPNPNAGADAVTLSDGRQLLVYNHTHQNGDFPRSREMLNVAVSKNGAEWKTVMTLERQEGEYSYPSVIQTSDGLVHITYTFRRESVKHVVLDPAKLTRQ